QRVPAEADRGVLRTPGQVRAAGAARAVAPLETGRPQSPGDGRHRPLHQRAPRMTDTIRRGTIRRGTLRTRTLRRLTARAVALADGVRGHRKRAGRAAPEHCTGPRV